MQAQDAVASPINEGGVGRQGRDQMTVVKRSHGGCDWLRFRPTKVGGLPQFVKYNARNRRLWAHT
jgi:hypothetical protein